MAREPLGLKAYALSLLARREYSRQELRGRLLAQARKRALWAATDPLGGAADPLQAFFDGAAEPPTPAEPDPEALAAEVDTVLDWLAERRHQSDARFVESRVHARAPKLGQTRIRQELARHGVELDADTQQALKDTEAERAREVWRKRFGEPATDPAERARQMRFLAARGFAPALIRRIVGGRDDD
ncbi:regulatory protein RecX [Ideonella alba]|uniref:regulatory protein RecX n=1 Tax=Ideonella alba TaxID=2824118 RepID=UPI001FFDA670|nr:regulatory protein RecX [Ideonella alba]